jgi:hypothetical protein
MVHRGLQRGKLERSRHRFVNCRRKFPQLRRRLRRLGRPGNPAGLSAGTIEIKYTLLGDANLDGIVNGVDFGILAANFNKGVTGWDEGDFDYNNIVNGTDFADLASNFNKGANGASFGPSALSDAALVAFAQANGLMADVPEPMSMGILTAGALATVASRRRHSLHRKVTTQE